MRFTSLLWLSIYLAVCFCPAAVESTAAVRRQVDGTATPTSAGSDTQPPPSSTLTVPSTTSKRSESDPESITFSSGSSQPTSSGSPSTDDSGTGSEQTMSTASPVDGPLQPSTSATENRSEPNALPLSPEITPALGVAGVFLILAGLVYMLIGVKNRWVQVFLSSAFLTSLSVTVLLIYVMNPPVRPDIQGAYLVAAFMTGVILGAGSLIFKEVTEGLGCLLGGFCLSMWLLTLTPGGTLTSTVSKAIFISVFALSAYAPSFHHRTRPYALIGATSFAGATAAVLGIDCFSKAGLKEFWLYIWNLNQDIFPLDTRTYPITRGMKVELAITVLMCLLGGMSQLKLWNVIKDRRQKKDTIREDQKRERDQLEEAIGRRLERGNERERAQWEATYDASNDRERGNNTDSDLWTKDDNSARKVSVNVEEVGGTAFSTKVTEVKEAAFENDYQATRSTEMAPLTEDLAGSTADDNHSRFPQTSRTSAPRSISSQGGGINLGRAVSPALQSPTADVIPFTYHSKASSLAATIDGELDGRELIVDGSKAVAADSIGSCLQFHAQEDSSDGLKHDDRQPSDIGKIDGPADDLVIVPGLSIADDSDPEEFERRAQEEPEPARIKLASTTSHGEDPVQTVKEPSCSHSSNSPSQAERDLVQHSVPRPDRESSTGAVSNPASLTRGALDRHPSQLSHVAMAYRTNEWAKHISPTHQPVFDEPEKSLEGSEEELPAPVEIQRLQPRPKTVDPPLTISSHNASPIPGSPATGVGRTFSSKSNISNPQEPLASDTKDNASCSKTIQNHGPREGEVRAGATDIQQPVSVSSLPPMLATHGIRSSSTPVFGQTIMTSPIDENAEAEFAPAAPSRPSLSPVGAAGSTLLAQRDSFLRTRHSQLNHRKSISSADMLYSQPPGRSTSRLSLMDPGEQRSASRLSDRGDTDSRLFQRSTSRLSMPASYDDDDMPLSQRKAMIQQQQVVTLLPENRLSTTGGYFDAHLPRRSSASSTPQKRESLLASWHESKRQEAALATIPQDSTETRRADMLAQKQQLKRNQQVSELSKNLQKNALDQAMRTADMQDLHRKAMRRMQASANTHGS